MPCVRIISNTINIVWAKCRDFLMLKLVVRTVTSVRRITDWYCSSKMRRSLVRFHENMWCHLSVLLRDMTMLKNLGEKKTTHSLLKPRGFDATAGAGLKRKGVTCPSGCHVTPSYIIYWPWRSPPGKLETWRMPTILYFTSGLSLFPPRNIHSGL